MAHKRTRWTPRDVWRDRGSLVWSEMTPRQKAAYLGNPGEAFALAFALGALALDADIRGLLDREDAEPTTTLSEPELAPPVSEGADLPPVSGQDEAHSG